MSHGIVKPIDAVISTQSTEWHGLADLAETIGDTEAERLFFNIIQGNVNVEIDGAVVPLGNHKALVADMRARKGEFVGTEWEEGLVPLHIPKKSYLPITNRELWEQMKKAIADIDATVSCIGTLEAGRKFFISVTLNDGGKFQVNGDDFLANLNFVTSHDGTIGVKAYDSTVRIVCMNTLRWSLAAAGEVGFNVYHTKNAGSAINNLGALVNSVLSGRGEFRNAMEYLASRPCDLQAAREISLGYLTQLNSGDKVSTRSYNAAEGITLLFSKGKGNKGASFYDLLNGATEYWTQGDGTGKKADASTKAYKANYGEAADHKNAFANLLMSGDELGTIREKGAKALIDYMNGKAEA